MKTVKFDTTFGNFDIVATARVSDEIADALSNFGALQVWQRKPASAAEKEMAKYDKRPKDFERKSLSYSESGVAILKKSLQDVTFKLDDKVFKFSFDDAAITQHVPTEREGKFELERESYVRFMHEGLGAEKAYKVGYTGELGDGTFEGAPIGFLRAIAAWKRAQEV